MEENSDEDILISEKTFLKSAKIIQQDGYREGAASGRNDTFQKGFDEGYKTGYKAGFELSYINGIHRALSQHAKAKEFLLQENVTLNQHTSRGACLYCPLTSNKLTKQAIAEAGVPDSITVEDASRRQLETITNMTASQRIKLSTIIDKTKQ